MHFSLFSKTVFPDPKGPTTRHSDMLIRYSLSRVSPKAETDSAWYEYESEPIAMAAKQHALHVRSSMQ